MANPVSNPKAEGRSDRLDELGEAERPVSQAAPGSPRRRRGALRPGAIGQAPGRLDEATAYYQGAPRQRPNDPGACRSLGNASYSGDKFAEVASCPQRTLRLRPDGADVHNNLGAAWAGWRRRSSAPRSHSGSGPISPEDTRTRAMSCGSGAAPGGDCVTSGGRAARAGVRPGAEQPRPGAGRLGPVLRSLACDGAALRLDPNFAEAHRDRAPVWLLPGGLERGRPEYDRRWRSADSSTPQFLQTARDGSPWDGRTLRLSTEQGSGDTLRFVRSAPQITGRKGRVVLAAPESHHPILAVCEAIDRLVSRDGALPEFDVHCPLMSPPRVLGAPFVTCPAATPHLRDVK
ncbi:MAG: tetratricopeptide repeat protein, partial [Planctomycetaceae bacterium]